MFNDILIAFNDRSLLTGCEIKSCFRIVQVNLGTAEDTTIRTFQDFEVAPNNRPSFYPTLAAADDVDGHIGVIFGTSSSGKIPIGFGKTVTLQFLKVYLSLMVGEVQLSLHRFSNIFSFDQSAIFQFRLLTIYLRKRDNN